MSGTAPVPPPTKRKEVRNVREIAGKMEFFGKTELRFILLLDFCNLAVVALSCPDE